MTKKTYLVKQSPIHGKGLFANTDINEGETIGALTYKPTQKDGPYVLWVNKSLSVEVQCDLKCHNQHKKR